MKKSLIAILISFLLPVMAFGAVGTVTQTPLIIDTHSRIITFICIGGTAGETGTIPNTATNAANTLFITGWYLTEVKAFRTVGGTQPDAGSVLVYDASGVDLLGSIDNSTAYQGLNLLHESLAKKCMPDMYLTRAGTHQLYYPLVTGALTLDVDDQVTASADWTIVMTFEK